MQRKKKTSLEKSAAAGKKNERTSPATHSQKGGRYKKYETKDEAESLKNDSRPVRLRLS